jgi:hypothetical protein
LNKQKKFNKVVSLCVALLIPWSLFLTGSADPKLSQKMVSLHGSLIRCQFAKNWSDTLHILGIDMLTDIHRDILEAMIRPGVESSAFRSASMPRSEKDSLQLNKMKEVLVQKAISNYSFFSSGSAPCLFGWSYRRGGAGKEAQTRFVHDLESDRSCAPTSALKYMCLVDCGGQTGAVNPEHASSFDFLDVNLKVARRVKCPESMFVRKVWPLAKDRFLVFHFPFAVGTLFSIVDAGGKVVERFYPASFSPGAGLREYFLDNFYMADYAAGKIFLAKVYPEGGALELEVIDLEKKTIQKMAAPIPGFAGPKRNFKKYSAASLGVATIAAVNGVFAAKNGDRAYISLSVNNCTRQGESFKHYLYRLEGSEGFTAKAEVPFGCVLYYQRDKEFFVSQKESSAETADQTEFVLFSAK